MKVWYLIIADKMTLHLDLVFRGEIEGNYEW